MRRRPSTRLRAHSFQRSIPTATSPLIPRWVFAFTQHLADTVAECLDEFNLFMRNVRDGLGAEVEPGDVAALTVAMTHVQHVKYTAADIDGSSVAPSLFDRLNGMVVVLRK